MLKNTTAPRAARGTRQQKSGGAGFSQVAYRAIGELLPLIRVAHDNDIVLLRPTNAFNFFIMNGLVPTRGVIAMIVSSHLINSPAGSLSASNSAVIWSTAALHTHRSHVGPLGTKVLDGPEFD